MKNIATEPIFTLDFKEYSHSKVIKSFLNAATDQKLPCAIWQLPGKPAIHIIISLASTPQKVTVDLNELGAGFLFSPFLNTENDQSLFIEANIYFNTDLESPVVNIKGSDTGKRAIAEETLRLIQTNILEGESNAENNVYSCSSPLKSHDKKVFTSLVRKAIDEINKGVFEKVVISRMKAIPLKNDFNIVASYLSLCSKYANALVSLVTIPNLGTWVGATPETLIKVDASNTFYTDSLAGTQSIKKGQPISEVTWTQKEIEEQALVSRYIINCFKKIRLREFEEIGPKTITAGNLLHLRTLYKVDMKATGFPGLGTIMVGLLHPTSAVCGMPQKPAMQFILKNENYDRSFYSGYLGPVNFSDETHLFVNLRCMQLLKDRAILYAGAGILSNSDPEKEWNETEFKCDTLIQGMDLL